MNNLGSTILHSAGLAPGGANWPWMPDQGDGTFRNPIIYADYSDPDVIRHGNDFYLTASSFNCTPGLPILHSRDLVNWTLINHAVKNLPHPRFNEVQPGCGIWAPALRFHAGRFWIFFPMPDEGIYVVTADDPSGRWSEPRLVQAGKGLIDPCPFWDDDGKAYLVHAYAKSRSGVRDILRVRPMAPDGSRLLGDGQIVFHSPKQHPTIEGPKFLKKDGWYYILAPAGGVATGWQTVLRSRNIFGPYEDRIVLEQGSTPVNGPHQGALVDLPDGDWWFVHFQDAGVYGRIVHLQPVKWRDHWPFIGQDHDGNGVGEPVLQYRLPEVPGGRHAAMMPQTSDEFTAAACGRQWQWQANHKDDWCSLTERPGWLRLRPEHVPGADLSKAPNLFQQKFPARSFSVETLLSFAPAAEGEEAGLVIAGRSCAALAARKNAEGNQLFLRANGTDELIARSVPEIIRLRVKVHDGGRCVFSWAKDGGAFEDLPAAFQATAGEWIGARIGLYTLMPVKGPGGHADFDYFRFASE